MNVSCEIKQGLITGLIGRNGAGKSTLFKAMLGLIHIDSGEIRYSSQLMDEKHSINHEMIGCVLTDAFFNQYLSAKDIKGILKRTYQNFDEIFFDNFMIRYHIPINKRIKDLSTGMKASVKIACALSHHPQLLILDEPTNGLDVIARDEILDILRRFMEEDPTHSILMSSHIFSDLENLCDEIIMMHHGNVSLVESMDELENRFMEEDPTHSILMSSHIFSDLENLCDEIIMMHHGNVSLVESMDELENSYGVLKVSDNQYEVLDKNYLIASIPTSYGYQCITNHMQFYVENYPEVIIEKCSMDEVFTVLEKGK